MASRRGTIAFTVFLLLTATHAAQPIIPSRRFEKWLWDDSAFANILAHNCTTEYNNWLHRIDSHWYQEFPYSRHENWTSWRWVYSNPLVACLLENVDERSKADMASSGIMLGLLPTILASVGSTLAETTLLSTRRPGLAFLLALGSPAVPILRTFEKQDVHGMLVQRPGKASVSLSFLHTSRGRNIRRVIVVLEFCLALAAIANVVLAGWLLGMTTIVSWSSDNRQHQILWSFLGGAIHVVAFFSLLLDVRVVRGAEEERKGKMGKRGFSLWLHDEFSLCRAHSGTSFEDRPDSIPYFAVSWFSAILTTGHFIYGTLIFSSLLFISVSDALTIVGRLVASTLCCRAVLMFELAGMRHASRGEAKRRQKWELTQIHED